MASVLADPKIEEFSLSKPARLELEHVSCDLCGGDEYKVRYRKPDNWLWLNQYEYPVVECLRCALVFVNPRPTFSAMAKLYPKDYHIGRDDEVHRKRYERQFSYISTLRPQRILDIGCARGDWLNFLHDKWPHSELHGVDAFSSRVHGDAVKFQQCALTEAVLSPDSFDLITAWAVFEHLHTPREYFETVARVLRPGGKFVFLVTNSESCYGKYANSEDVPRHLYHFSERILSRYADRCRLRLESTHYDDVLWDGRGHGTFRYLSGRLAGVRWDNYYFKRFNLLQRTALLMGRTLDRFVFSSHWEARLRRSGIMVAVMGKGT